MGNRRLPPLLLAVAVVLVGAGVGCADSSGDALPPTTVPTATSTAAPSPVPAATGTPTPTAAPTPTPTATPTATPDLQTCTQTTLGVDPATNSGLAADCAALLAAKAALADAGALNWSADTAITDWDGVTLSGTPQRVTGLSLMLQGVTGAIPAQLGSLTELRSLDLSRNRLTGSIPSELESLSSLSALFLGENELTGCVPRALRLAARNDLATLGLESCALPSTTLSYDTYDTTGAVTAAGSYAFLGGEDGSSVVTTCEGLRDGSATRLRIHASDAGGVSRAGFYHGVEAGDIIEWHKADDCFVRYTVQGATARAATRNLVIAWMTYAFTGCSGAIETDRATVSIKAGPLPNLGGVSLTSPVRHGAIQLVPAAWDGPVEEEESRDLPRFSLPDETDDIAVARTYEFWREPRLPADWTFARARKGGPTEPPYGFCADYETPEGYRAAEICGGWISGTGLAIDSSWTYNNGAGLGVIETRVIHGRPAIVDYSPRRPEPTGFLIEVWVYDDSVAYSVFGAAYGGDPDPAIAIAESLFE